MIKEFFRISWLLKKLGNLQPQEFKFSKQEVCFCERKVEIFKLHANLCVHMHICVLQRGFLALIKSQEAL